MTTLQMQRTSLPEPPVIGDLMDVTSDMDRDLDFGEEIDIDLDVVTQVQQDEEDEYMNDDRDTMTNQVLVDRQPTDTVNDDEMIDEAYPEIPAAEASSIHDEDIQDVEYAEPVADSVPAIVLSPHEDVIVEKVIGSSYDPPPEVLVDKMGSQISYHKEPEHDDKDGRTSDSELEDGNEQVDIDDFNLKVKDRTPPNDSEDLTSISPNGLTLEAHRLLHQSQEAYNHDNPMDASGPSHGRFKAVAMTEALTAAGRQNGMTLEDNGHAGDNETALNLSNDSQLATGTEVQKDGNITFSGDLQTEIEVQDQFTDFEDTRLNNLSHIHPVVVLYQDNEISLFPLVNQEEEQTSTYFLHDEQLANDTITNLLKACRSVLGESIGSHDELTIEVEDLDLQISESTPESSSTSLADLIDIYVQLQHYDGLDDPPPLYIHLIPKTRFSHRLEFLMNSIAEEKGISHIRSSINTEEPPKPIIEEVASPYSGRGSPEADVQSSREFETPELPQEANTSDREFEAPELPQEANTGDLYRDDTVQTILLSSTVLSEEASSSTESTGKEIRQVNPEVAPSAIDAPVSKVNSVSKEALPSKDAQLSSSKVHLNDSGPPKGVESSVDDEDFIDYDDDQEAANQNSSGSSTIQGDDPDVTFDEDLTKLDEDLLSGKSLKHQETQDHAQGIAKEELTALAMNSTINNVSINSSQAKAADYSEDDVGYRYQEYSEEEDANSLIEDYEAEDNLDIPEAVPPTDEVTSSHVNASNRLESQEALDRGDGLKGTVSDGRQDEGEQSDDNQAESDGDVFSDQKQQPIQDNAYGGAIVEGKTVSSTGSNRDSDDRSFEVKHEDAQISIQTGAQSQDEDDEITYDDEEDESELPNEISVTKPNGVSSPASHKRARGPHDNHEDYELDLQDPDPKRVRID